MTSILALDASTELCSVALLQGDNLIERVSDLPRSHAARLLPMVDEVLAEGGCSLRQLDAIAFGAGPGSFTGLRICIGVVQGLAFGANLPVVAVSSLETMAFMAQKQYPESTHESIQIVPAIDARMKEIYWAAYTSSSGNSTGLESAIAPQVSSVIATDANLKAWLSEKNGLSDKSTIGVGSGWALLQQSRTLLSNCRDDFYPRAAAVAKLGEAAFYNGAYTDAMSAEPIYLRTEISWKKRERIRG